MQLPLNRIVATYGSETVPKILAVPQFVFDRIQSTGLNKADVFDFSKMSSILSPRELNFYFKHCYLPDRAFEDIHKLFDSAFRFADLGDTLRDKADDEKFDRYCASLRLTDVVDEELNRNQILSGLMGYTVDINSGPIGFTLDRLTGDIFAIRFSELPKDDPNQAIYYVYEAACEYLFGFYGFRWLTQTGLFKELVQLSQLPSVTGSISS